MRIHRIHWLGALWPLLLAGCSPYSPDLGETPFRCGADEPRCPEGYACIDYGSGQALCERDESGGEQPGAQPDARPVSCGIDGDLEPNDTTGDAVVTPIPELQDNYSLVNLAICPDTDVDLFRFKANANGINMSASVAYEQSRGELGLSVLNSAGVAIQQGEASGAGTTVVSVNNLSSGTWYVQVQAASPGVENNYEISITTSP